MVYIIREKILIDEYLSGHNFTTYIITDGVSSIPLITVSTGKFSDDVEGGFITIGSYASLPDINITHDIDESLYGDDILLIDKGHVIIHDTNQNVYKHEKELKSMDYDLPFMVDLSNKLSYYDLVDDFVFDMNEMVDLLWK